jgi:hypothetical protein
MSAHPRLLAVGAAIVVAEILWAVATFTFGLQLQAPANNGYPAMDLGPLFIGMTAGALSLAAWAALGILERLTSHARTVWLLAAPLVLLASLSLPLSGTDVSIANRAVLLLMHVGVAAVLIPAFYRTSNPFHPAGAGHGVGQASTG